MNKSEKIFLLANIVLVGFVAAVVFHYVLGFYMQKPYPFDTFLMPPNLAFGDFLDLLPQIKGFAPYTPPGTWQQYFPLAYIILAPFAYIKTRIIAYFIFFSVFLGFFAFANKKFLSCENSNKITNFQNIFILTLLSYPFLFLFDRGNFDMLIFIFFAAFIFSFQAGKYRLAAVFLGIMNATKPFSILFLILFLFDKKYKEFFLSIGLTFLLIVGGFMVFKGDFFNQIVVMLQSWILFQKEYVFETGNWGMANGSSLFTVSKFILCKYGAQPIMSTFLLSKLYSCFVAAMTVLITVFAWREKTFWKRISLITLYMLLVPQSVYDYKLIFLFVPIYLFVNAQKQTKSDLIYTILFGLLLIPKHYFIIDLMDKINNLSISMFINPIVMLMIISLIIREQFTLREKDVSEEKN